jgi:hypothetical protein
MKTFIVNVVLTPSGVNCLEVESLKEGLAKEEVESRSARARGATSVTIATGSTTNKSDELIIGHQISQV